ncbi:MAG: TonB-dependent receptor domain-containing protein, partial [Terriglobales bacterium]
AELGRAGGGVVNVITRSGTNSYHGTAFYYLRDNRFAARHPSLDFKPNAQQHQFGATLGGRLRRDRAFFYVGFDQHIFDIPAAVRFRNGYSAVVPTLADMEASDYSLVTLAAKSLSTLGGVFPARMLGNAAMVKADVSITPHHQLAFRANASRYWGKNNVYFDPSSPVTFYATSDNGEERVATETALLTLTSGFTKRISGQLRAQFSRDLQQSFANADWPEVRIYNVIDGFGRASILPRQTREHRMHLSETLTAEGRRHEFKLGGDVLKSWIYNFFPSLFGGRYTFDDISVNPWTFQPQPYSMWISPLRAYAHSVPRYYTQNFGSAISHPDTTEWAAFAQDTVRFGDHLAVSAGLRWDFQTFRTDRLVSNYFFRDSGRVPVDGNNVAPRLGFALSFGRRNPLVIRGGAGLFYTRIPSIYNSAIETDNGERRLHVFLNAANAADRAFFPVYPAPLVACPVNATECDPPASLRSRLESEVSAFAPNFVTPSVRQASVSIEREVMARTAVNISALYVRGQNLIRARDLNLPPPVTVTYPVYDATGTTFTGQYMTVQSFSGWEMARSATCSAPPCIAPLKRPYPQLGSITVFESAAVSEYYGFTVSARRRMHRGMSWRIAYTWGHAMD